MTGTNLATTSEIITTICRIISKSMCMQTWNFRNNIWFRTQKKKSKYYLDTMGGIHFSVCGCQSENHFICFGAKPTQRPCARDIPRDRMWVKEERSERRQKKWVSRREQKWSVGLREQSREGEGHSRQKSAWLVPFVGVSLEYTLALAYRIHKRCQGIPLLALGADPSLCLFVSSFLPPSRLCFVCP